MKHREVSQLYRQYLIRTNAYCEDEFDEKLQQLVHGRPRFDEDYNLYIRGIQGQIRDWIDEALQFITTIKVMAEEGTIEDSIVNLVLQGEDDH